MSELPPFWCWYADGEVAQPAEAARLTVLNFSGGTGSAAVLWMVLTGVIPRPEHFLVLNADPGMENEETYPYVRRMFAMAEEQGIKAVTAEGPNLAADLLDVRNRDRIDQPPFFTLSEAGGRGKLAQRCTAYYKIAPMDRAIRKHLHEAFGISAVSRRIGRGIVEKWVGFTSDEVDRIKPPEQKYMRFAYPLVDLGMSKEDVRAWMLADGLPIPPRSVCNACFANSPAFYARMRAERPKDWAQAVAIDEAVRDMSSCGVTGKVFVSNRYKPLEQVADGAALDEAPERGCDSGYCFT